MDDGSIPAEARIRPRPSDPREERVSSSEAILSFEQVVSKEKEKARSFRLCLRGDDGAAGISVDAVFIYYLVPNHVTLSP